MAILLEKIYYIAMRNYNMKLLAGIDGIWNNVDWIHTVEDRAVLDFLKGQELVIITGIKEQSREELVRFTEECYLRGSSGLVFNIGPYIPEVPKEVIDFAEEKKFPVFTLPWEVRLVEFNREFCDLILQTDQMNQNLCSAFRAAIFSPGKQELYLPVLEREGIGVNDVYCIVQCMPVVSETAESIDNSKLFYDLRQHCERIMNRTQKTFVIFRYEAYLTIVASNAEKSEMEKVVLQIDDFHKWQSPEKGSIYFAMSDDNLRIEQLSEYYDMLGRMCKIIQGENRKIWRMDEMGIYSLLMSVKNMDTLKRYKEYNIGVLERYDEENKVSYCDILYAYLKCNGKMQEVADQCFLHRNTIAYHLKRIEEILNCNLYSTEDRVRFYLALEIRNILKL